MRPALNLTNYETFKLRKEGIYVSKLPVSTATNVYDLINDLIQSIRNEYRRMNMGEWWERAKTMYYERERQPSCGVVACAAGWIMILARPQMFVQLVLGKRTGNRYFGVPDTALNVLSGTTDEDFEALYDVEYDQWPAEMKVRRDIRNDFASLFHTTVFYGKPLDEEALTPGTVPYGEAVIAAIQNLQEKYADILKTTPVRRDTVS